MQPTGIADTDRPARMALVPPFAMLALVGLLSAAVPGTVAAADSATGNQIVN